MKKNTDIFCEKFFSKEVLTSGFLTSLFILFSFLNVSKTHAAPNTTLYFNPASDTVDVNETFTLDAMVNPGTNSVAAVELHVTFDPAKFTLNSITPVTTAGCSIDPALSNVLEAASINNTLGTASIIVGVCTNNPAVYITAPESYATFSFTSEGSVLNSPITITSASQASAAGESGDVVTTRTPATITVSDVTAPTFTINEGTDAGPVASDTINVTAADETDLDEESLEYGFSANNVCDGSDTYGNSFTNSTNFTISTTHNDYLCVRANDSFSNPGYQLIGQLNVSDITAPTGYSVNINQSFINSSNETALSFAFASAEVGATYNYSIDDVANGATAAITGTGTITSASYTVSNVNVSTLDDGTLTLTAYLTDTSSNQGANVTDTVSKDTTVPTVDTFTIPATATTLSVSITDLSASDNIAVSEYIITESSSAPAVDDENWQASEPTEYIFATEGAKTLYAWVRDAAGNVSTSLSDSVTITLPTYTIGGTVADSTGSFVLQNNDGDDLTINANGAFTFATAIHSGDAYDVTVLTNPTGQDCTVTNGSGTVASANISNIQVLCVTDVIPPVLSAGDPSGELDYGTTSVTISVDTNEDATCRYSTAADTAYGDMTNNFSTTGAREHSTTISPLTNGSSYAYYVRCMDENSNPNTSDYGINFSISATESNDDDDDDDDHDRLEVSKVKYEIVSNSQIKITWKTNNKAREVVRYGKNKNLKEKKSDNKRSKNHTIYLNDLTPGTKYYFRISSEDSYGQTDRSKTYSVVLSGEKSVAVPASSEKPKTSQTPQSSASAPTAPATPAPAPKTEEQRPAESAPEKVAPKEEKKVEAAPIQKKTQTAPAPSNTQNKASFKWWNPLSWF